MIILQDIDKECMYKLNIINIRNKIIFDVTRFPDFDPQFLWHMKRLTKWLYDKLDSDNRNFSIAVAHKIGKNPEDNKHIFCYMKEDKEQYNL